MFQHKFPPACVISGFCSGVKIGIRSSVTKCWLVPLLGVKQAKKNSSCTDLSTKVTLLACTRLCSCRAICSCCNLHELSICDLRLSKTIRSGKLPNEKNVANEQVILKRLQCVDETWGFRIISTFRQLNPRKHFHVKSNKLQINCPSSYRTGHWLTKQSVAGHNVQPVSPTPNSISKVFLNSILSWLSPYSTYQLSKNFPNENNVCISCPHAYYMSNPL